MFGYPDETLFLVFDILRGGSRSPHNAKFGQRNVPRIITGGGGGVHGVHLFYTIYIKFTIGSIVTTHDYKIK